MPRRSSDTLGELVEAVGWLELSGGHALSAAKRTMDSCGNLTASTEMIALRTISAADEILTHLAKANECAMRAKVEAQRIRTRLQRQAANSGKQP